MILHKRHRRAAVSACAVVVPMLLAMMGCHVPNFTLLPRYLGEEKKYLLRHLDGISLEDESTSSPVKLDDALTNQTETLPEPNSARRLPSVDGSSSPEELP